MGTAGKKKARRFRETRRRQARARGVQGTPRFGMVAGGRCLCRVAVVLARVGREVEALRKVLQLPEAAVAWVRARAGPEDVLVGNGVAIPRRDDDELVARAAERTIGKSATSQQLSARFTLHSLLKSY